MAGDYVADESLLCRTWKLFADRRTDQSGHDLVKLYSTTAEPPVNTAIVKLKDGNSCGLEMI